MSTVMSLRSLFFSTLAFALAWTPTARAAETTEEHRALMIAGQVMRNEGKLLQARETLRSCESEACEDASDVECKQIRAFCKKRLEDVQEEIPSVRAFVVDDLQRPLPKANIRIGNQAVSNEREVELDPGHHVIHADYLGRTMTLEFDLERRSKHRALHVVLDLRRIVRSRPLPWYFTAFAATGVGAGLGALGFGLATNAQHSSLDACRPTCNPSERGLLTFTTVGTDVSLALAVVSGMGALVSYLTRPEALRTVRLDDEGRGP